jgi:hypothetical protein
MPSSGWMGAGAKGFYASDRFAAGLCSPSCGPALASTIAITEPRRSLLPDLGLGPIVARLAV